MSSPIITQEKNPRTKLRVFFFKTFICLLVRRHLLVFGLKNTAIFLGLNWARQNVKCLMGLWICDLSPLRGATKAQLDSPICVLFPYFVGKWFICIHHPYTHLASIHHKFFFG